MLTSRPALLPEAGGWGPGSRWFPISLTDEGVPCAGSAGTLVPMAGLEVTSCGARAAGAPVQPVPRADLNVPAAGFPGQNPACLLLLEDAPVRRILHLASCLELQHLLSHTLQITPRPAEPAWQTQPWTQSSVCSCCLVLLSDHPVEFPGASAPVHPGPQQGPHLWVEHLGCALCAWRGSVAPSVSTTSPLRGLVCVSSRSCALSPLTQRLHS